MIKSTLSVKEQAAVRKELYETLQPLLEANTNTTFVPLIGEGLLVSTPEYDAVVRVVIKQKRVDIEAELTAIAEKEEARKARAAAKAKKIADAQAKREAAKAAKAAEAGKESK